MRLRVVVLFALALAVPGGVAAAEPPDCVAVQGLPMVDDFRVCHP